MAGKERFPAIVTPRSLPAQHRDVQAAVQNIKERIEALEAAHDALAKTANEGIFALKSAASTSGNELSQVQRRLLRLPRATPPILSSP